MAATAKACEKSRPFIGATDMNGVHGDTQDIILNRKNEFHMLRSVPGATEKISKMFPEDLWMWKMAMSRTYIRQMWTTQNDAKRKWKKPYAIGVCDSAKRR